VHVSTQMPFSGTSLFVVGGPVLWLLLLSGVFALVMFVERALFLHRAQIRAMEFCQGIKNLVLKRRLVEAVTVCEETPGPVAALVKAALMRHQSDEGAVRAVLEETAQVEVPLLERRMGSIAAVSQVAPVLGLLGTVLGAIEVFSQYQAGGDYALASNLAGGIWQALLTTAAGLTVGLVTQVGHHFLAGRVRALTRDMEWAAGEMLRFITLEMRSGLAAQEPRELAPGESVAEPRLKESPA
jgi:biopolymer transport protein ExbB